MADEIVVKKRDPAICERCGRRKTLLATCYVCDTCQPPNTPGVTHFTRVVPSELYEYYWTFTTEELLQNPFAKIDETGALVMSTKTLVLIPSLEHASQLQRAQRGYRRPDAVLVVLRFPLTVESGKHYSLRQDEFKGVPGIRYYLTTSPWLAHCWPRNHHRQARIGKGTWPD